MIINHKYKVGDIVSWIRTSKHKIDKNLKEILKQQNSKYEEENGNYVWSRTLTGQIIEVYDNRVTVTYIGRDGNIQKTNAHKRTVLIEEILDK